MAEPLFIILAAGSSTRMGEPKALIEVCERPLIAFQIERIRRVSNSKIVVVTREDLEDDIDGIIEIYDNVDYCINHEPEKGRTGSLQIAISTVKDVSKIVVVPVDRPGWTIGTLKNLLKQNQSSCPMKDDKGGHPVLILGDDIDAIKKAKPDDSLRNLFKTYRFDVNDQFLHLNVDSKKDIATLVQFAETLDY